MGTLTGFVVGYLVGAQTGPESWKKLKDAAKEHLLETVRGVGFTLRRGGEPAEISQTG